MSLAEEEDPQSAPPKLFEHSCRVFEAMRRAAKPVQIQDGGSDRHALVFEGFMTQLFRDLNLSTPYYSRILRRLQRMGCIIQLSRGGGNAPSRWELLKEPEYAEFSEAEQARRRVPTRLGQVEQRVVDINDRLGTLEDQFAAFLEAYQAKQEAS
jgi:hypothetical protein